jgi:tetratricopeptide (TPR) repeat protein
MYRFIRRWLHTPFLIQAVLYSTPLHAQSPTSGQRKDAETDRSAAELLLAPAPFNRAYQNGDYAKAASEYAAALKDSSPNDRGLKFGLASALFKLGRFDESAKIFGELAAKAPNGREYFEATYNRGNALLAQKRYSDAIDAFWSALDLKPDDQAANHNLKVARELLELSLKATPTPTDTPTPTPSYTQSSPQTPQASPSAAPSPDGSPDNDKSQEKGDNQSPPLSGTPSPVATPPQAPPQSSQTPATSPEPDADGSPITNDTKASPEASPSAQSTAAGDDLERLKEALDPTPGSELTPQPAAAPSPEANYSPIAESDAWLESLPDSPILIRRYRGTPASGGQTW